METAFEKRHQDLIVGKVTTVDRMIFNGHLTAFFPPGSFQRFLTCQGVWLRDFGRYVRDATERVKAHAMGIATEAKRPYIYQPHVHRGKDDLAKEIAARDGIKQGLICVLATLEMRSCFDVRGGAKLEIVRRLRRCLHLYFYFIDPDFGLMHVRIQTWFPFQIQVYLNGREWLARQLDKRGIAYERYDNSLLQIEDLAAAQRLCERFTRRKWVRILDAFARRINPLLPLVTKHTGRGYYWVIDQCEVATDIMWRNRRSLEGLLPDLFDHTIRSFSAEDVMRFLGRKLTGKFQGDIVSDHKKRPEGRRVKHRIKSNWIKMYDKWSVLRIETTINKPCDFQILRAVTTPENRRTQRWVRMTKGVANLWRYLKVGENANQRYLEALGQVEQKGKAIAELDSLCRSRAVQGKTVSRFQPVTAQDCALFRAVLAGENMINGFRNRDLCRQLYQQPPHSPEETARRCARVSRLIRKLRGHGLLAKVHSSRVYRVTPRGYRTMSAALHFRHSAFPEGYHKAA
jgi:hypothetical protein